MSSDSYMIAWLVPILPLIGFAINGLFGGALKKAAGWLATLLVFAGFGISLNLLMQVLGEPETARQHAVYLGPWMNVPAVGAFPALNINFELLIDPLSLTMMMIITGVGGLIHLYSIGYMANDPYYTRFFTYLNLFVAFMLMLVMGNNFLELFIGWEGVGLCSYLLIGYFFEKQSAGDAAKKAFIMNRIGDVGVLIGMFMIYQHFGTLDFIKGHAGISGITDAARVDHITGAMSATVIAVLCLMLFLGATGKSAQIPLYTWLPDAMEGPTPVSALIHAATMVTAGVYMVSRTHTLFEHSDFAMSVVCVIGIATAILAAAIGLTQNDIKRVLAYSTVSQLGYMFAACGAGVFAAGMFHVMTHAFFKACLFLCSGSVIHSVEHGMHAHDKGNGAHHDENADLHAAHEPVPTGGPDPHDPQDMRNMGGLKSRIPVTFITMLIATLAISGIYGFAGYWSKDEILWRLFNVHPHQLQSYNTIIWGIGVLTALMTAFYMFRLIFKTFFGEARTNAAATAHESPATMTIPLVILAFLSVAVGWPFSLSFDKFQDFLAPSVLTPGYAGLTQDPSKEAMLGIITLVLIVISIGICASCYLKSKNGLLLSPEARNGFWYKLSLNKFYVDEAYNFLFVKLGKKFANWLWHSWEDDALDGIVNGVGGLTAWTGSWLRRLQTGYVRNYAFSMVIGIVFVLVACLYEVVR